jgi:hypothetical protein
MELDAARARRWGYGVKPLTTRAQAAKWIDRVGFALLFAKDGIHLPAILDVARGPDWDPSADDGWGPEIQRVWAWKDELPDARQAWSGHFLRGRSSLLSPSLLGLLYPGTGDDEDAVGEVGLSREARQVAELLLVEGALPTAELRRACGLSGKQAPKFTRAVTELSRKLLVSHRGTSEQRAGWPSVVLDLTPRVFAVPAQGHVADRRRRAAEVFTSTMVEAEPNELARAFNWTVDEARLALG